MSKKTVIILLGAWLFTGLAAQNNRIIVHDPVAIAADGAYYMFSTGRGIASWTSDDKLNWHYLGRVFNDIPAWCKQEVPKFDGNIWAPDISFHNGKYYLYYSISSFASNRSAIGVATNMTLDTASTDYAWVDHGMVVESVAGRDHYNAIDPHLVMDEEGSPWLSFGSFWGGMKLVQMNDDLLSVAEPEQWATIATRERTFGLDAEDPGDGAIEAPFIVKKDGYYYLFVSFDLCCRGARSTYNVRVGRSESITGPYLDRDGVSMEQGGGTLVVEGDENYYGVGHNSVYQFDDGWYMYSHGYDRHHNGRPRLVIHRVHWDAEGWPGVEEIK
ncbi:MAG: arabinan endo-1,5-alpha-L-arabinosidase [Bacteroidales bacterium]|nr:arabinan endo-1,5-alpha-L-arabinosidase [Bacteroidales bacterium]